MTSLLDLAPGLYSNVPAEDYHQRVPGVVSKTALDLINRSLAHYKAWVDGAEREATPPLLFGSALHMALLEPERFLRSYVVMPDFGDCRFKENKARRDSWRLEVGWHENPSLSRVKVLEQKDADAIRGIYESVNRHPLAGRMIREGVSEATLVWEDEETGLRCKARMDYYAEKLGACYDLKSTEDARPEAFARSMASYRYHVQDAFYREGLRAVGRPCEHFVFIAVEKQPPYAVALYSLKDSDVQLGLRAARRDMRTLLEGIEKDAFPAYSETIETISLPGWYTAKEEE